MAYRLVFATIIVLLLTSGISSQINLNITTYKETEGMGIYDILVDKQGQVWLATNTGLVMYNGYKFKKFVYNPNDSSSIKGTYILRLYEDSKGKIWVSTSEGQLYRYNPVTGKFKEYLIHTIVGNGQNDHSAVIASMATTTTGETYFGVAHDGPLPKSLLIYDIKNDVFKPYEIPDSLNPGNIGIIRSDQNGNTFFMGLDSKLYYIRKGQSFTKINPYTEIQDLANHSVSGDFRYDEQDRLWVVSDNGTVSVFDQIDSPPVKTYTFRQLVPTNGKSIVANTINFDKTNTLWIGMNQGLIYFDRQVEKFQYLILPKDNKGNGYQIFSLFSDSFNNLWIGTQNGLLKYEKKPVFISYSGQGRDSATTFKGDIGQLHQARNGNIIVPTYGGEDLGFGFDELNLKTNSIARYPVENILPKGVFLFGYAETGTDTFQMGTDNGIYQYDRKQRKVRKIILPGVPNIHPGIFQFYRDLRGNEWVGTVNYLYKKLKGMEAFTAVDLSKHTGGNEKSNRVYVEAGSTSGLWLLTGNGLFFYEYSTDSITRHGYDKKEGDVFIAQDIYSTYQDSSGYVWVGIHQGGLNRYDVKNKKIKVFTVEDGLADINVYSILCDEINHTLWLGTQEGISRFDMRTEKITNYTVEDGIIGKRFGSKLKTTDGQFFFGGDGLVHFHPADIPLGSMPPLVSITDFKVSNRSIAAELDSFSDYTTVTLNHHQNNITIDFLGVHYSNPNNNKHSYTLENYDEHWTEVGTQHSAYYTNLPPGSYTFKVKAANNNGVWNEQGARLNIVILPPWWKTNWAYALYILGIIGLGSLANQYFKQRVLKKERERTQLKELEQAKEIEKAYKDLEVSHQALKATQSQLIQSEKMASLGELTAGVAHEIQNPLNFVNNFAEVNTELIEEANQAVEKGDQQEAKQLLASLRENEEKIRFHGQRADAIVKSMLQHSRVSNSKKELTDINALADEYLRLSYHGLRAKDKSFNSTLETNFDPSVGKILIISQDIGRVLLNLYNNAFYAVHHKYLTYGTPVTHTPLNQETATLADVNTSILNKMEGGNAQVHKPNGEYKPMVSVQTKRHNNQIVISISDNGNGIPQKIQDKIFQPFFTTKPTGQGTGLGLSLAYDIIKAHMGELTVKSSEGTGTEFAIVLPV